MITHSDICGPCTPDEFVIGILVSFQIGVLLNLSVPALKRWMSLRFLAFSAEGGKDESVTSIVA